MDFKTLGDQGEEDRSKGRNGGTGQPTWGVHSELSLLPRGFLSLE